MPIKSRAALIFNPAAGRGEDDLETLRQALAERFELAVHVTSCSVDADACARAALAGEPEVVVVAGGDGTVSLVAGQLIGSPAVLGIIPRGTSNSIAAALGIPADRDGALAAILAGEVRLLDSARVNGRAMLLHASVGFHAATVADTPRDEKNRWGVLAYVKEGLAKLASIEPFQVRIETENEIVQCLAVNVAVANAAPLKTVLAQGPARVVPDDGLLDVTIVAATGLAEAVATGLHLLRSALREESATRDNVGYLSARRLRIQTDPAQPLVVDGEAAGEGSLFVQCMPGSIRVFAPRDDTRETEPRPAKLDGLPELEVDSKA